MTTKLSIISFILLTSLFLAACSAQAAPTDASAMGEAAAEVMDEDSSAAMSDDDEMGSDSEDTSMAESDEEKMSSGDSELDDHTAVDDMTESGDSSSMDDDMGMTEDQMVVTPDWFNASLTNIHTGETFTVADFEGQVVLVETLAMWCSNCFKQQGQVQVLHDLLGERDDFISLGVDIDPNENAEALQTYTTQNGFDWFYTVAPVPVAREIGQLYGDQFLNPPSTPMLIVDRRGEVHTLPFGIKSAEDLRTALQPFLDTEM